MYSALRLRSDSGDYHVLTRQDQLSPEMAARYVARNIGRWLSDPLMRRQVIDLTGRLPSTSGIPTSRAMNEEWQQRAVQSHLEEAFRSGDLVLYRSAMTAGGGPGSGDVQEPRPSEEVRPAPPPRRERKTWVEIRLVDDEGLAIPSERCRIELPDGTFVEGRTDDRGIFRVDSVEEGACEVTFPDIDLREWGAV